MLHRKPVHPGNQLPISSRPGSHGVPRRMSLLALGLAAIVAGSLATSSPVRAFGMTLTASPNPASIPAGQTKGTTTLSWDTGDPKTIDQIFLQRPNQPKQFLAKTTAQKGSIQADVIQGDNAFVLYDSTGQDALAGVDVQGGGALPKPPPLTLHAVSTPRSIWNHIEQQDCGFPSLTYAPDAPDSLGSGQTLVGYENDDAGCTTENYIYRGGVSFNWTEVNTFVKAHGAGSASLSFSALQGDLLGCVGQIQINTDDVTSYHPFPPKMPGGAVVNVFLMSVAGNTFEDTFNLNFIGPAGNLSPHLHFVFIGTDESAGASNDHCWSVLGNFTLTVTPEH